MIISSVSLTLNVIAALNSMFVQLINIPRAPGRLCVCIGMCELRTLHTCTYICISNSVNASGALPLHPSHLRRVFYPHTCRICERGWLEFIASPLSCTATTYIRLSFSGTKPSRCSCSMADGNWSVAISQGAVATKTLKRTPKWRAGSVIQR